MMGVDILGGVLFVKREKLCVKVLDGAFPFSEVSTHILKVQFKAMKM